MSKKILGVGIALVLVAAVFVGVGATTASAQSMSLCQTVDALVLAGVIAPDKVAAAKAAAGCGATASVSFTRDLTVGSTGADVTALQTMLGVSPATGYFGPITKAAVVAYQTSKGISGTGYVGPLTRAALNAVVVAPVVTPGTPAATGLSGNAGDITVTSLSTYSGEDVKAGEENVKVLGLEVEADDESDVDITSMKVELKQTNAASSKRITDYVESVDIYMGSTKVGSADASDFTESSNIYTKSISLDGAIVDAGEKAKFYIALNAISNLDSGDIDAEVFSIDVLSMRFMDGDGVSSTDTTNVTARTADFVDLVTSGDVEVRITENSANPDAMVVEVDDVSDTNDVLLLAANMKVKGSDVTVDQLSFNVSPVGANANEMVSAYKLLVDGEEVDEIAATSIAAGVTSEIVFTNLEDDFAISEDDTVVVKVVADVMDTGGNFGNGDSISASLTNTNLLAASSTIEDENGDDVAAGDRVGSVVGNAQTFYTEGVEVNFVSGAGTPYTIDGDDNDRVELVIKFTVKAFGQDAYIPSFMTPTVAGTNATVGTGSSSSAPTTASGVAFHVQSADTGLAIAALAGSTLTSTAEEEVNSFKVVDGGDTETFTLTVKVTNSASSVLDAASLRAILTGVNFASSDVATGDYVYTSDLSDYKTSYTSIAN